MSDSHWQGDASAVSSRVFDNAVTTTEWWDAYTTARPTYTDTYWRLVYGYHDQGCAKYDLAHDIACGPGNILKTLAASFKRLVASDVSKSALDAAVALLPADVLAKATLVQIPSEQLGDASAEQLAAKTVAGSRALDGPSLAGTADFVLLSECIPLMDADRAVASAAALLRPGGTLAISFYGRLTFADTEQGRQCQRAIEAASNALVRLGNPTKGGDAFFQRAARTMASKLDNIGFDERVWSDVERHKWNVDKPAIFMDAAGLNFDPESVSRVREGERVVLHGNEEAPPQRERLGYAQVKAMLCSAYTSFNAQIRDEVGDAGRHLKELARLMGGARHEVEYPSVIVLARRR